MDPFLIVVLLPVVGLVFFLTAFWILNIKIDRKRRVRDHILVEEIETWLRERTRGKDKED